MDNLKALLEKQEELTAKADKPTTVVEGEGKPIDEESKTATEIEPEKDVNKNEDEGSINEDELIKSEIDRFKQLVGFDGELEDFSVDSIAKVINTKIDSVKSVYTDPDLQKIAEWKASGRSIESYLQAPMLFDKTKIDLEKDSDLILSTALKSKGLSDDEVTDYMDVLNLDSEKKSKKVNEYLDFLEAESKKEYDKYINDLNEKSKDAIEKAKAVDSVITSGDLGFLKIEDSQELGHFKSYLESQDYDKKWNSLTPQQIAYIEYLVFSGFKNVGQTSFNPTRKSIQIVNIGDGKKQVVSNKEEQIQLLNKITG